MKSKAFILILSIFLSCYSQAETYVYQTSFESQQQPKTFKSQPELEKYLHSFGYSSTYLKLISSSPIPPSTTYLIYAVPKGAFKFTPAPDKRATMYKNVSLTSTSLNALLQKSCNCQNPEAGQGCISASTKALNNWTYSHTSSPYSFNYHEFVEYEKDYQCSYQLKENVNLSKITVERDQYYDCIPPSPDNLPDLKGKTNFLYQLVYENGKLSCTSSSGGLSAQATKTPLSPDISDNKSCNTTADPVDLTSGILYETATDYLSRSSAPIKIERFYNSKDNRWSFSYTQYLNLLYKNGIEIVRPNGNRYDFKQQGNIYVGQNGISGVVKAIKLDNAPKIEYDAPNGAQEIYDANTGFLQSIRTRSGLTFKLSYSNNQPSLKNAVTVTSPFGQKAIIQVQSGEVGSISLPNGNSIQYSYDAGHLQKVVYPNNHFVQYQYDSNSGELIGVLSNNPQPVSSWGYQNQNQIISNHVGQ